jgi:hypothetical protein
MNRWLSYIARYFVARTLWNATHPPAHRLPRVQSYAWQEGDEIILVGRGHFINHDRRWERVVESPDRPGGAKA